MPNSTNRAVIGWTVGSVVFSVLAFSVGSDGQTKVAAPILEDATSAEVRNLFVGFKALHNVRISGTATLGTVSGPFTMARDGNAYTLTLPEGAMEDKELVVDLHGGVSCEITRQGRLVSKSQNALCGFPLPWFFPIGMLPTIDRRILRIESSANADHIVLTITPSAKNLAVHPSQEAKLFIDAKRGTLDSYAYRFPDVDNAATTRHVVVTYEHYRLLRGLLLPESVSRSVDGGTPLMLSIDSIEAVSQ